MKSNFVPCSRGGRVHFLVCHLRCPHGNSCKDLKDYGFEQARFVEEARQDCVLPASQRFLPGWSRMAWPVKEVEEKKKSKNKEDENGEGGTSEPET